jgi:hypothetical protein
MLVFLQIRRQNMGMAWQEVYSVSWKKSVKFRGFLVPTEQNTYVYDTAQLAVLMRGVNEDHRLMEGRPEEVRVKKQVLVTFSLNW